MDEAKQEKNNAEELYKVSEKESLKVLEDYEKRLEIETMARIVRYMEGVLNLSLKLFEMKLIFVIVFVCRLL